MLANLPRKSKTIFLLRAKKSTVISVSAVMNVSTAKAVSAVARNMLLRQPASTRPLSTTVTKLDAMSDAHDESSDLSPERGSEKCVNSVTLLGRVGVDPQLRGTDAHPVVSFSLATNLRYRPGGQGDYVTKTDWHNVAVFRPFLRESVHQNVAKGMRVMVQGRLMYGSVEDKAGVVRHTTTIVADDVIRLSANKA